ncbi:MAG: DNA alkylation repair protein [Bacillota bacterium]
MPEPLKSMYNEDFLCQFGSKVKSVHKDFDSSGFVAAVLGSGWDSLELKARMRRITISLGKYLPWSYDDALEILFKIDGECVGFPYMFFPDFVEVYGQVEEDWDLSMKALERFTIRSSSEFAVRPFLIRHPKRMMEQMYVWSKDSNEHVRRLASEGCRPQLPWGQALPLFKKNPDPILPILDQLKADPYLYVRKSVANNLNDISKTHPDLVIQIAKAWYGENEHTNWMIKHACRTLLKKGNKQVLAIFGYEDDQTIQLTSFTLKSDTISIGMELNFSFELQADKDTKARIEFAIDYVKAKGNRSRKIFKISETQLKKGETRVYAKNHSLKDLTTRKHYKGIHTLSIILNGKEKSSLDFRVE